MLTDRRGEEPVGETLHYEGGIVSFVEFIHKRRQLETINDQVIYLKAKEGGFYCGSCPSVQR